MYNGFLLINKPSGWTSFDVVAKIRGILQQAERNKLTTQDSQLKITSPKVKVGHAGTLDPLATGLMIILVGSYCKRADEFMKLDKTYDVTMKLGVTSATGDEEGDKVVRSSRVVDRHELKSAMKQFIGDIMQVPPAFSAIKVNGKRAYKLAREGKAVALEPRQVTVNRLQITEYNYPIAEFTTDVSSGTYIRSLVNDIGDSLGVGAYMNGLVRTKIGIFELSNAIDVVGINAEKINTNLQQAVHKS